MVHLKKKTNRSESQVYALHEINKMNSLWEILQGKISSKLFSILSYWIIGTITGMNSPTKERLIKPEN